MQTPKKGKRFQNERKNKERKVYFQQVPFQILGSIMYIEWFCNVDSFSLAIVNTIIPKQKKMIYSKDENLSVKGNFATKGTSQKWKQKYRFYSKIYLKLHHKYFFSHKKRKRKGKAFSVFPSIFTEEEKKFLLLPFLLVYGAINNIKRKLLKKRKNLTEIKHFLCWVLFDSVIKMLMFRENFFTY